MRIVCHTHSPVVMACWNPPISILEEKDRYVMVDAYLGPDYSEAEIKSVLDENRVPYTQPGRDGLLESTDLDPRGEGSLRDGRRLPGARLLRGRDQERPG